MTKVLIATYSQTGRTQAVADQLAELLPDADQFAINVPADTFPDDMYKTSDVAKAQIKNNDFPALTGNLLNLSQYDVILVGSPVWSGAPATPIHTFLDQIHGFTGKVAPFYTDAGVAGDFEGNFRQWAKELQVLPGHENSRGLEAWVRQIGSD